MLVREDSQAKIPLPHTTQGQNVGSIHKVKQTTRSADENIATLLELRSLMGQRSTSIHNARAQHGTVAKTASLIKDLGGKLSGRSNHKHQRLSADRIGLRVKSMPQIRTGSCELLGLSHQLGKNRNKESCSLSRT